MNWNLQSIRAVKSIPARVVNRLWRLSPPVTEVVSDWIDHTGIGEYEVLTEHRNLRLSPPEWPIPAEPVFHHEATIALPRRYLARIPGVTIRGLDGYVVLPDGSYALEVTSKELLLGNPAYHHKIQMAPTTIEGPVFSLLSMHCRAFFHWHHDVLGRLHGLVEKLPSDIRFLLPKGMPIGLLERLSHFGVQPDAIIEYDPEYPVRIDDFYFAPLASPQRFDDPSVTSWLRTHLCRMLDAPHVDQSPPSRIYISRKGAQLRRVANEDDLLNVLIQHGFTIFSPEQHTLSEQARMFSAADVVAGPHGAGFTNCLYSKPGALLIELFPESIEFRTYYWSLASALGMRHAYLKGKSVVAADSNSDFTVDPEELDFVLNHLLTGRISTPSRYSGSSITSCGQEAAPIARRPISWPQRTAG